MLSNMSCIKDREKVAQRKEQCGTELRSRGVYNFVRANKVVFYQCFRLCHRAVALPVSSASCELLRAKTSELNKEIIYEPL